MEAGASLLDGDGETILRASPCHDHAVSLIGFHPSFDGKGFTLGVECFRSAESNHLGGGGGTAAVGDGAGCFLPCSLLHGGGKQLVLNGCGPSKVLRLSAKAVDGVVVVHEDAARGGELACLVIAAVPPRKATPVDPVTAMEPVAVKEAGGREEVCAFAFLDDNTEMKIIIWCAQPFDTQLTYGKKAGEIVEVFYNNQFVVATGDGTLLVTDYDGFALDDSLLGHYLGTRGIPKKIWQNLPE